jgi:beta-mannosidase
MVTVYNVHAQQFLNWNFHEKDSSTNYELGVKGTVQSVFVAQNILPNPFYGLNESKFNWIEDRDWIFESTFSLTEEKFHQPFIYLNFNNIDTYATIYVNGQEIGKSASAFIRYRFDIKPFVKIGKNTIRLHFVSPINYNKQAYKALKVKFPTPNDVNDSIQVSSMTRKPQFQFGWDWSLRMNTIGLNEPVFIESYSDNKVLQSTVQTETINENSALMKLIVVLEQVPNKPISIQSEFIKVEKTEISGKEITFYFTVQNPKLYWPKEWGEQFLYKAPLRVFHGEQLIESNADFYFGISKKELIQQVDEIGTSFEIHWNGKLIFCKGGDYIPQDVFLSTIDESRMKKLIDDCVLANFNMIRIWGGGYYLPDFFYRYCAEKGILIWQDFMFACALYPGDTAFLNLVKQELDYQIPRIASHPNIAIFNGNNEVMVASKYWGFKTKYNIDTKTQEQFDENYRKLFQELIPNQVNHWATIPYVHTSPLSHWGKEEWYNNGTQHYWGVWHGSDPIEDFARKSGRFNAEYGFQSFPEYSTLLQVSEKSDWDLKSPVIKQHQKSYVGNEMILKQTKVLFGTPRDFEDFIYLSQLTQAEAVGLAIASHRLQYPRTTGTIYWQINDCWPVSSWSSIDYYNNWKALHYRVKADFEPVAVLRNLESNNEFSYWLSNQTNEAKFITVKAIFSTLEGKHTKTIEHNYNLSPNQKQELDFPEINNKEPYLIQFEWTFDEVHQQRTFIGNEKKYVRNSKNTIEIEKVHSIESNKAEIHLHVKSFTAYPWITSMKGNIFVSSNFQHLLPGYHKLQIEYTGEIPTKQELIIKGL